MSLVRQRPELTLVPPAALEAELWKRPRPRPAAGADRAEPPAAARRPQEGQAGRSPAAPSWWTARAQAGEVKPGFTKEEILRPAKDDPRAPGGVFERVGELVERAAGSEVRYWI